MGKARISVFLDDEQIESLKSLSVITRVKMADYIREGVNLVLERYRKELKDVKKKGGDK